MRSVILSKGRERTQDGSDMTGLRSFKDTYKQDSSTSGSAGDEIIETQGVYSTKNYSKFGVNDRHSNGTSS